MCISSTAPLYDRHHAPHQHQFVILVEALVFDEEFVGVKDDSAAGEELVELGSDGEGGELRSGVGEVVGDVVGVCEDIVAAEVPVAALAVDCT